MYISSRTRSRVYTYLQLHPRKEVPDLSPAPLLLQDGTHFWKGELSNERRHDLSHVVRPFWLPGKTANPLDSCQDVLAVQVGVPLVFQVLGHLFGVPLYPPLALLLVPPPPQGAQVYCLCFYYATGVAFDVGGESVLLGFGFWFWFIVIGVSVAQRPRFGR